MISSVTDLALEPVNFVSYVRDIKPFVAEILQAQRALMRTFCECPFNSLKAFRLSLSLTAQLSVFKWIVIY